MIGDVGKDFDAIAVVEYPNAAAFLAMRESEAYRAIAPYRELASQWLLATTLADRPASG